MPRSACASAQSDLGLHCSLIQSLDIPECFDGKQMHGRDFSYAQDDVNLHSLRMLKGTFSLDAGQMINYAPKRIEQK